jgi:hypothetical protein
MRTGLYRLDYQTATLIATGVIVLENGSIHGCDKFYFMSGTYRQEGDRLNGTVTFTRHTENPSACRSIPEQFELRFEGLCRDNFGQFDVHCHDVPEIRGGATFNWLGATH